MSRRISSKQMIDSVVVITVAAIVLVIAIGAEAKLFGAGPSTARSSRMFDSYGGDYDGYGARGPYGAPTGERAILTIRGTRNPYDGSAPSKLTLEDNPYRGPFPRGVYDRNDAGYGGYGRRPLGSMLDYGYGMGGLGGLGGYGGYGGSGYGNGYNGGLGSIYGRDAPRRIAVTGAYPLGYGARF